MSVVTVQPPNFTHDQEGTSEALWSTGLAEQRSDDADSVLVRALLRGGRVVVVAPHPDDETLGAGGLISMASAAGSQVTVVSCTDGEAAAPVDGLGAIRRRELDRSLRRLAPGAAIVRLALPDGLVHDHRDTLLDALSPALVDADVVVGPWAGDGHPDHEAVGRACEALCRSAATTLYSYPVWAWHWGTPQLFADVVVAQLELTASAQQAKAEALRMFESQTIGTGSPPILNDEVLAHFGRTVETFVRSEW